jgi:hypothetical protein
MNKSLKKNSLIVFSRFNLTLLFRFKNRWCQRLDLLRLIGKSQPTHVLLTNGVKDSLELSTT